MLDLTQYKAIDRAVERVLVDYPTPHHHNVGPDRIDVYLGNTMVAQYDVMRGEYSVLSKVR